MNVPAAGRRGIRDTLSGPWVASSIIAVSRTVRVSTCSQSSPPASSSRCGPTGTQPRLGFNPTRPHTAAGTRMEPPESVPCAIGTSPAATAAAAPPLDPPGLRPRSQGFRVGPRQVGSVTNSPANSGVLVRPRRVSPAARQRAASGASATAGGTCSSQRQEYVSCMPAMSMFMSLARKGTPHKGAVISTLRAASSAAGYARCTTALSDRSTDSIRAIAASASSDAVVSPRRTSSARPTPSKSMYSSGRIGKLYRAPRIFGME